MHEVVSELAHLGSNNNSTADGEPAQAAHHNNLLAS